MKTLIDIIVYILVRSTFFFLNLFPIGIRLFLLEKSVFLILSLLPKYQRIMHINLKIAFPDSDKKFRDEIIEKSCSSLARLVVDFGRIHSIDRAWVDKHVDFSEPLKFLERPRKSEKGRIYATGHLGSFELLAHSAGLKGYPLSYVFRQFKNPYVDAWWNNLRKASGNTPIPRRGAIKKIMKGLSAGDDVAILFDQNVTRNHAFFAPWFSLDAAVTKAVGLAAVKNEAEVIVASVSYEGDDKYKIHTVECDFSDVYSAEGDLDSKIEIITKRISQEYTKMIAANPEEWFWMHRRWKTRPDDNENIYNKDSPWA